MGWLELLALLKRVLPLLSRVAPMLESYVVARGATRDDSEALDRLSAELKTHLAAANEHQSVLRDTLDIQNERLLHLSDELQRLRTAGTENSAKLEQIERQIASTSRLLRLALLPVMALLLVCVGLLVALLLRH